MQRICKHCQVLVARSRWRLFSLLRRSAACLVLLAGFGPMMPAQSQADDTEGIRFFESKIRPVLVKHCYECHSADAKSLKGGLLVDSAAGLRQGGDSGPAVIEGRAEDSVLMQALRFENYEMPPSGKLPETVIADFERWIAMGAPDPRTDKAPSPVARTGIDLEAGRSFWAFQPVEAHTLPKVQQADWPRGWIDQFVLAQLEEQGLPPQPDADRATLLRRIAYDLTGLPPTPADLQRYLDDPHPEAVAEYVDQLLESPQYGLHWGRHWLDVARYADSNGADFNASFPDAWRYRNYIIDSFNADRPFSELIIEQIAGDLLPAAGDEQRERQLVATGFLMLGSKMLSERDKEKLRMDVVDDQVSTIGSTFLGLTLGCARCHDHKFDPIPTRDYYAMAGIMRSTQVLDGEIQKYVSDWVRQPLPINPEHAAALKAYDKQLAELKRQLKQAEGELKGESASGARAQEIQAGIIIDDADAELVGSWKPSTFNPGFIGKGYIHDDRSQKGEKQAIFRTTLPMAGEYTVRLAFAGSNGRATNVPVTIAHADGESTVAVDQSQPAPIAGLFKAIGTWKFPAGQPTAVTISNAGTEGYVIIDAVQFVPVEKPESAPAAAGDPLLATVEAANARVKELKEDIKKLQAAAPPPAPMAFAVNDAPDKGDCNLCIRGETNMLGAKVPRGFLSVATFEEPVTIPKDESGRLELARWVSDPRNPLTSRVYVNRVWHHLLGAGLVRSVDNFGQLGERPTHPDLLDQLAVEFISHNWSTKWLIREIVLSRSYQLSSGYDAASWNADPENRLLWRAHRKRIPAEAIRDTMLAAAGKLDLTRMESPIPGLGVLISENKASDAGFVASASNARTVYQPIIRSELPSLLRVFDFADPDFATGERARTNVPAQALWMLNGDFVARQANLVVQRAFETDYSTVSERIDQLSRLTLGRPASPRESQLAQEFMDAALLNAETPADEQQAWTDLVHALFASSSFRMLD